MRAGLFAGALLLALLVRARVVSALSAASEWRTVRIHVGMDAEYSASESQYPQFQHQTAARGWLGQCEQDRAVVRLLGAQRDGFFVDLGAHDALVFSNTAVLEQRYGWRGICIEPVEAHHWGLAHRRCAVVSAVVGDGEARVEFDARPGCDGVVSPHMDNRVVQHAADARRRPTVRLDALLDALWAPQVIDYLSLDIEGAETVALRALFEGGYSVRVLTVERPKAEAQALLRAQGYRFVRTLCPEHGDLLYAHPSVEVPDDEFEACGIWCASNEGPAAAGASR